MSFKTTVTGRKVAMGAFWGTLESLTRQALTLIIFLILAKQLGPEAYGVVSVALALATLAQIIVTRGMPEVAQRRQDFTDEDFDTAHWYTVGVGLAGSLVVLGLSWPLAKLVGDPRVAPVTAVLSTTVIFAAYAAVPTVILRRQMRIGVFALRTTMSTVIAGAIALTMVYLGAGLWSLVAYHFLRFGLSTILLALLVGWTPQMRFSLATAKTVTSESANFIGQGFASSGGMELVKIVIGTMLGATAVGIYTVALRLLDFVTEVIVMPVVRMGIISFPAVHADTNRFNQLFTNFTTLTALVALPAFIGLSMISPIYIPLLFGAQWEVAIATAMIAGFIGIDRCFNMFGVAALNATGHAGAVFRWTLWELFLGPIAVAVGALYSLELAAMMRVPVGLLLLIPLYMIVQRRTSIRIAQSARSVGRIGISVLTLVIAILAWRHSPFHPSTPLIQLVTTMGVGALAYGVGLVVFARPVVIEAWTTLGRIRRQQ